eukprot:7376172-Prymnesium_polylepis.1
MLRKHFKQKRRDIASRPPHRFSDDRCAHAHGAYDTTAQDLMTVSGRQGREQRMTGRSPMPSHTAHCHTHCDMLISSHWTYESSVDWNRKSGGPARRCTDRVANAADPMPLPPCPWPGAARRGKRKQRATPAADPMPQSLDPAQSDPARRDVGPQAQRCGSESALCTRRVAAP